MSDPVSAYFHNHCLVSPADIKIEVKPALQTVRDPQARAIDWKDKVYIGISFAESGGQICLGCMGQTQRLIRLGALPSLNAAWLPVFATRR